MHGTFAALHPLLSHHVRPDTGRIVSNKRVLANYVADRCSDGRVTVRSLSTGISYQKGHASMRQTVRSFAVLFLMERDYQSPMLSVRDQSSGLREMELSTPNLYLVNRCPPLF